MYLRQYKHSDCKQLAELFYQTVHAVNAADYTAEQLNAWATGEVDLQAWDTSFSTLYTVVAVENEEIVGFGNIDKTGYLDMLYVGKDSQRRGIASAICDELERSVSAGRITTHASVTAKPFFLNRGYRTVRKREVPRRGVLLTNYLMEKRTDGVLPVEHARTEMNVMIRPLQNTDIAAVADIWLKANLQAHDFVPAAYWEKNFNSVKAMLPQAEVYVFESGDIQGFIGLNGEYIEGLFVAAEARSQGIGKRLLDFAKSKKTELRLNVYRRNARAIRFYRREGFEILREGTDDATGEQDYEMIWRHKGNDCGDK